MSVIKSTVGSLSRFRIYTSEDISQNEKMYKTIKTFFPCHFQETSHILKEKIHKIPHWYQGKDSFFYPPRSGILTVECLPPISHLLKKCAVIIGSKHYIEISMQKMHQSMKSCTVCISQARSNFPSNINIQNSRTNLLALTSA